MKLLNEYMKSLFVLKEFFAHNSPNNSGAVFHAYENKSLDSNCSNSTGPELLFVKILQLGLTKNT